MCEGNNKCNKSYNTACMPVAYRNEWGFLLKACVSVGVCVIVRDCVHGVFSTNSCSSITFCVQKLSALERLLWFFCEDIFCEEKYFIEKYKLQAYADELFPYSLVPAIVVAFPCFFLFFFFQKCLMCGWQKKAKPPKHITVMFSPQICPIIVHHLIIGCREQQQLQKFH